MRRGCWPGTCRRGKGGCVSSPMHGKLVAQIDTFHDRIQVYDGEIRAGSVGGVCTHPEYRERRLAGRLMEYCAAGTGRRRRQSAADFRRARAVYPPGQRAARPLSELCHHPSSRQPHDGSGCRRRRGSWCAGQRRPMRSACSRLYAAEPVHFARTYADFAEALQDPPGNTYVYADRWMIERGGEAVAYLCLGSPWHEELPAGIRHMGEYAGSRTAHGRGAWHAVCRRGRAGADLVGCRGRTAS